MSSASDIGGTVGSYLLNGMPFLSIKNFSKFHVMSLGVMGAHEGVIANLGMVAPGCGHAPFKNKYKG